MAAAAAGNKQQEEEEHDQVALLGSPVSPFSIRARMALHLKGVSYEYVEEDLFNKSRLLRSSNPVHRKVPVLIHNGRPICESLLIVEYVDEAFAFATAAAAPAILPADPYRRAIARFWAAYIDHMMLPDWLEIMKATTLEARLEMVKRSDAKMKLMEEDAFAKCSNGGEEEARFFGGDSIGYLDLALGSFLFWFKTLRQIFGVDIISASNAPLLSVWAGRFVETPTAKEVAPPENRMVEHVTRVYRRASSSSSPAL